jgi:hypothetical protein
VVIAKNSILFFMIKKSLVGIWLIFSASVAGMSIDAENTIQEDYVSFDHGAEPAVSIMHDNSIINIPRVSWYKKRKAKIAGFCCCSTSIFACITLGAGYTIYSWVEIAQLAQSFFDFLKTLKNV